MLGHSCHSFSLHKWVLYLRGHFCCVHLWTAWAQFLAAHMAIASAWRLAMHSAYCGSLAVAAVAHCALMSRSMLSSASRIAARACSAAQSEMFAQEATDDGAWG